MAIHVGGQEYARLYVGGVEQPGLLVGGAAYKAAAPVRNLRHTYAITCGVRGGFLGWWWNASAGRRAGSITGNQYDLPDGTTVTIRQTMVDAPGGRAQIPADELRFLVSDATGSLGTGDIDQFPSEIETENAAGDVVAWTRKAGSIAAFGQGIGVQYTRAGGSVTNFANGAALTVRLYD